MSALNLQINFKPNEKELNEIEEWLKEEDEENGEGFYCNWSIISKAFSNNGLIIFKLDNQSVGFCVFSDREIYVEIDIFEIRIDQRGKGIGGIVFSKLENQFKKKGFKVAKLSCSPIGSESFWRKVGFIDLPPIGYYQEYLTLYKPLIKRKESNINQEGDRLELWNQKPGRISSGPKWVWQIPNDDVQFDCPILQPCNQDWKLRLIRNEKIIKEDNVKYFTKQVILNRLFLYIEKIEKNKYST